MYEIWRCSSFFQPAYEHCDVSALSPAVSVQLVKDKKAQTAAGAIQKSLVLRPNKNVFGHHVVGKHDLGWMLAQLCLLVFARLAGVLGERDRKPLTGPMFVNMFEVFEGLKL
jgi:hypothetical protein